VHWPNRIKAKGEIRSQFHHVIDVAPTILEAAGLPEPVSVNGVQPNVSIIKWLMPQMGTLQGAR
jgi:arylsulfatase A-like enzyme